MKWILCVVCRNWDREMYMPKVWMRKGICEHCNGELK